MNLTHFILIGPEFPADYRHAIKTAEVHGGEIILWHTENEPPDTYGLDVRCRYYYLQPFHEGEERAHVWDNIAYEIGYSHGGLVLGLDTISLRPAHDLLRDADVVLSTDWPEQDWKAFPDHFNNNFLAKAGSEGARALWLKSCELMRDKSWQKPWGYTGPIMLTELVKESEGRIVGAPYPTLCGWSPGYIWRFYLGHERPPPETRVIHLCKTAYRLLHERKYDEWAKLYPFYSGPVLRRTNLNDDLLKEY